MGGRKESWGGAALIFELRVNGGDVTRKYQFRRDHAGKHVLAYDISLLSISNTALPTIKVTLWLHLLHEDGGRCRGYVSMAVHGILDGGTTFYHVLCSRS